jgi:hypothetical protein
MKNFTPDTNYQLAPWIMFEEALSEMKGLHHYPDIAKECGLEENTALCTFECACFFFQWKDWKPWNHYVNIVDKLFKAHSLIMKREVEQVFILSFFHFPFFFFND